MRSKTAMTSWLIMALLTLYNPLIAQHKQVGQVTGIQKPSIPPLPEITPMEEWTEEQILSFMNRALSEGVSGWESLNQELNGIAARAVALKSDKIKQKILDIPEQEDGLTRAKIRALGYFKDYPGVHDYVVKSLNHPSFRVQLTAANKLLIWGEWDLAAPVICKYNAYNLFQQHKDQRAIPLLEEGVKSGSWQGRIYAAAALYHTYGDSTQLRSVALDIILNAPGDTDDENTNRAIYMAFQLVPRFNMLEALPGVIRLAQENDYLNSSQAVTYLQHYSDLGYQEATQALIDIKDHHNNANIREQAKQALLKIEEKKK